MFIMVVSVLYRHECQSRDDVILVSNIICIASTLSLLFVLSLLFCSMHPAVKFFQRFQAGLLADVISSLVWTLAGDQQCTIKLTEKCGLLCDARVEENEVQIFLIIASDVEATMRHVSGSLARGLGEGNPEFDAAAARYIELGSAVLAEHDEKVSNLNAEALLLEEEQKAREMAKKKAKRKKAERSTRMGGQVGLRAAWQFGVSLHGNPGRRPENRARRGLRD